MLDDLLSGATSPGKRPYTRPQAQAGKVAPLLPLPVARSNADEGSEWLDYYLDETRDGIEPRQAVDALAQAYNVSLPFRGLGEHHRGLH